MFSPGRYLVVDDETTELRLLVDALHADDAPCIGVHWTGAPMNPAAFSGVHVLFSDLYLVKGGKAELESPMLLINEQVGAVRLLVNARFQISAVAPPAGWTPLFRIREQLLTMINAHAAEYQTRPGVVKLPE